MILIRFLIILLISISSLNAQSINLNSMIVKEPKLKGVQFKEFLTNHEFTVSRGNRSITFIFKGKVYEIRENNNLVQKGTWKMNIRKNNVRLKPYKGAKSFWLQKFKGKPLVFHYNTLPGKENTIKTTYKIIESNKNNIKRQIAKFQGTALQYDIYVKKKKNALNKTISNSVSAAIGFTGDLGKFGSSSELTHYYFEASNNYLRALELLYRAYDNNVEADKINASLKYMNNSKNSEGDRLKSTKLIIDSSTDVLKSNIQNASYVFSELGRSYYEQALPFAFAAGQSTVNLISATSRVQQNVKSTGSGLESFFQNAKDIGAIMQIVPEIPKLAKNMSSTIGLVFSGAKEKKIRDNGNLNAKLKELDLDFE